MVRRCCKTVRGARLYGLNPLRSADGPQISQVFDIVVYDSLNPLRSADGPQINAR